MISEESCDTDDWSNAITGLNYILKYIKVVKEITHKNSKTKCNNIHNIVVFTISQIYVYFILLYIKLLKNIFLFLLTRHYLFTHKLLNLK